MPTPDAAEIAAIAKGLGISLDDRDAQLFRASLVARLEALDRFMESPLEEAKPPIVAPEREPGYRPGPDEDPLNAWTWKCRITGNSKGLLAGKTVSFKDNIAVAQMPMSCGTAAFAELIPGFDATVVTRVLEAGGTVVGKNNMASMCAGVVRDGRAAHHGVPLNPHNPEHVSGGSSNGSAVAVAAGEVDISFGGDAGGSIRSPAAFSGVVGLKPTFGLVSHFGISHFGIVTDPSVDHTGPIARTVEDAAAALQAVAGYDEHDPRQRRDVPADLDVLTALPRGVSGVRIGLLEEGFEGAEADVRDLVMSAVDVLAGAGADVRRVSIPEFHAPEAAVNALSIEGSRAMFDTGVFGAFARTYYPPEVLTAFNRLWITEADLLRPRIKLDLIAAEITRRHYYGRVYAKAHNVRPFYVKVFNASLADVDVLVLPTCIDKAPERPTTGTDAEALAEQLEGASIKRSSRNTLPFNFTGHPALAVPVGKSAGLPVSMQLVGRFFEDPLLLQVAYAYEHSVDWEEIVRIDSKLRVDADP